MRPRLSMTMRAFLFAFLPVCSMLAALFFTIHAIVREKITEGLKQSMLRTERAADIANADFDRRSSRLLSLVSDDAGLKAGIGLLREAPYGHKPDSQALQMVKDQMRGVFGTLDYDLVVLADPEGMPIAGFDGQGRELPLGAVSSGLDLFPLLRLNGVLYEGKSLPINLGAENLATVILGKKFDLSTDASSGYAALLHDSQVILTNFPGGAVPAVQSQIVARCGGGDCEVRSRGTDYLAVRVERASLGDKVQLFKFQSIDAAANEFIKGFERGFLIVGAAGCLVVLLFSVFASRSFSKPLTNLIEQLNQSERTGQLHSSFTVQSSVKEVNQLAMAFNRAAEAIQDSQLHLERASLEFVETMAQALDARDPYTAGHSNRVSVNSTTIAEAMSLPRDQVEIIRIGAKLHDIGKIGVPDTVLQKPGALTNEEFALIRLHPQIGKRILEKVQRFQPYLPIVELHHEDYGGGGYPYGLRGEEIPLGVRIVHIADVYDAITSHRAYRKAMSEEQVTKVLLDGSGKLFDPMVLEVFFSVLHQRKILDMVLEQATVSHVER